MSSVFSSCDFIAGWAAGVLALMVGHPLDTIKVWSQTLPQKSSSMKIISTIYNNDGVKGFYKGLMFPLMTAGPLNSLFFGVYGNTLRMLQDIRQVENTMCWFKTIPYKQWHWDVYYAGCMGGFVCSFLNCPVELIKIQMQTQIGQSDRELFGRTHRFQSPWQCLLYQYKSSGIRGIYKGYVPLFWRDVPGHGLYVLSYEKIICLFGQNRSTSHHSAIGNQMIGGALAGLVWTSVVPFDVIKSRIQADSRTHPKYKGMLDCIIKSYHSEGFVIFFRGSWLICMQSIPVNVVIFVSYEYFISLCS